MSSIKNLHFKLGEFTLDLPSLELSDSGITTLQGPSGSGKSTLLNVLIGIHKPRGWQWNLKGEDLSSMELSDRRLGVVFQSYDLFPHLSAEENILVVLNARYPKVEREFQIQRLQKFTDKLHLKRCWHTLAQDLSGGEKQRVALLRAIFSNPRLLLLDEPFAALDPELRAESRAMIKELIQQSGIPALIVTHDELDVQALSNFNFRMQNGKVVNQAK